MHNYNRDEVCKILGGFQIDDLPVIVKRVSIDGSVINTIESLISILPGYSKNRFIAVFRKSSGKLVFVDCIRIDFIEFKGYNNHRNSCNNRRCCWF